MRSCPPSLFLLFQSLLIQRGKNIFFPFTNSRRKIKIEASIGTAWKKWEFSSEMKDIFENRKKSFLIASPIDNEKYLRTKKCTEGRFYLISLIF